MRSIFISIVTVCLFTSVTAMAQLDNWLASQQQISIHKLFSNISPEGTRPGAVVASPSTEDPDYWYHWVRDAALVMDTVHTVYLTTDDQNLKSTALNELVNFIQFTSFSQSQPSPVDLGEPKYYVDGRPFDGPWGRPQNDGPALRAFTLIKVAKTLASEGHYPFVNRFLYNNTESAIIKRDLEYVVKEWQNPSFDLWEEIKGQHFYTRMAQRIALYEGADLADAFGDHSAALKYRQTADMLTQTLKQHASTGKPYLVENIDRVDGIWYKNSGLDTATVLAFLHTQGSRYSFRVDNDWLLSTIYYLEQYYKQIYNINKNSNNHGTAFGRYPEDVYYGGNPWFLTTLAIAEHHTRLSKTLSAVKEISVTNLNLHFYSDLLRGTEAKPLKMGDLVSYQSKTFALIQQQLNEKAYGYFNRVKLHVGSGGQMDEQMDKNSGYMLSARDLTWSYASFITAFLNR